MNGPIKQDYFKLIRDLNKSNKNKDVKTELTFIVIENKLYATISKDTKILLCHQTEEHWYPSNYSLYLDLEDYIAVLLNKSKTVTNLDEKIKLSIFQLLD